MLFLRENDEEFSEDISASSEIYTKLSESPLKQVFYHRKPELLYQPPSNFKKQLSGDNIMKNYGRAVTNFA